MKKFLEVTKDYIAHTYFLDAGKQKCFGYIKNGTKTPIMFSKPLQFDARRRTFVEVK